MFEKRAARKWDNNKTGGGVGEGELGGGGVEGEEPH